MAPIVIGVYDRAVRQPALTVRVGVGWSPLHRAAVGTPRFFSAIAALEALGYDSIWLSDTATGAGVSPLPVLAAVAARTERLKLGTSVLVVPPRAPALLAKELATIDLVSAGRLLPAFGLGIDRPVELAALGIAREERVARLEEAVAVIDELWSGEPVTYRGRFTSLEQVTLSPRPTRTSPEIWLSGSSAPALRRVGRIAKGWLASRITPAEFAAAVAAIRAAAATAGRAIPDDHYGMIVPAARSDAEAERLRGLALYDRPGVDSADLIGVGVAGIDSLLRRFRAAGATKFVLVPLAADPIPFLRELKAEVVDPFEAAG
jgi:probable F420-dependent oxidoreductase